MKNKMLKRIAAGVFAVALAFTSVQLPAVQTVEAAEAESPNQVDLKLWYDEAAPINTYDGWEKWSLPIGNSGIGASVFGGVVNERIQLNEKSLWSGGPSDSRKDYQGGNLDTAGQDGKLMKQIQEAFKAGNTSLATSLCNQLVGVSDDAGVNGYGYYLSYGNMYLDFTGVTQASVKDYKRYLDLRTAVTGMEYTYDGTKYTRENFVSYPDNVLVTRLKAEDGNGKLNFKVRVEPDNQKGGAANNPDQNSYSRTWDTAVSNDLISIDGQLKDNQMQFSSQTKVIAKNGGTITNDTSSISVSNATEVVIITSIATDYRNDYPKYRTEETKEELSKRVKDYVENAAKKEYETLKSDHIKDYSKIFSRVELDLGQEVSDKTTDALLAAYKSNTATEAERRYLEVMLFQYGRYLTIESSRETPTDASGKKDEFRATLPSNLQGIWVGANNSAWHSDYHMNVNLQMNYWPTYSTNMAECAEPLINYVDGLREPGRVTAEIYAGIKTEEGDEAGNGFMAHTQNNPFGWTCPGWAFSWGWSPAAVPWILQNCWDYYSYTMDENYLREMIYPMMREEAILYDQLLIDDGTGKLVTSPTYSPEHGPYTAGNTYEQTLIWQLYEDTIEAAKILNKDSELVKGWEEKQKKLKGPIEIGDSGQIKEWYTETTVNSMGQGYGHRHLSHMLGLFPGDLISEETPEWFAAARVSMENRTDSSTGWGMGQRINTWARLADGNRAYKLITDLFAGGILTNLWDTHSPYQIDGNFGMTSGVAEMLLQSNQGYMNLLPALPDVWANGSVDGLVAQGNFVVDMDWANGGLVKAEILSRNGGTAVVQVGGASRAKVTDSDGKEVKFTKVEGKEDRISFETTKDKTYTITGLPAPAPTGLKAVRIYGSSTDAYIKWNEYEGEGVSFNVYRRTEDEKTATKIAENLTDTEYTDENAGEDLGDIYYRVSAVVDGKETVLSKEVLLTESNVGKADDDSMDYPREKTTATAGCEYQSTAAGDGPASYAVDGNTATWWHTNWASNHSCGVEERWITLQTQEPVLLDALRYLPRESSGNGRVTSYTVEYSLDNQNWTKIAEGTWENAAGWKLARFDEPVKATYVRLTGVHTAGDATDKYMSATEVRLRKSIGTSAGKVVNSVKVASVTGMTTVAKAASKLQLRAEVKPEDAADKSLTWTSSDETIATVSADGLVTFKDKNGIVTITAAAKADSSVSDSIQLTAAIPGGEGQATETIVDDGEQAAGGGDTGVRNEAITWSGNWSTYAGEPEKHYGTTKTEATGVGSYFQYTFNGTGIEVYGQKHTNFASFEVYIDDELLGEASFDGSANGDPQSLLFQKLDLKNGQHTIKCVIKERAGKEQANLDYLKIFAPGGASDLVDKSDLQDTITEGAEIKAEDYSDVLWTEYQKSYQAAVRVMNDAEATEEEVASAKKSLADAIKVMEEAVVYTVTAAVNDEAMGSAALDAANGKYAKGAQATATASANDGYMFVNWTNGGKEVSTQNPYTFEVTADTELTANFKKAEGSGTEVNKDVLEAKVEEYGKFAENEYTEDSWKEFAAALKDAEEVLANTKASQAEVDAAVEALDNARAGLVKLFDKKALEDLIAKYEAEDLKASDFTEATWSVFNTAMKSAKELAAAETGEAEAVSKAYTELKDAYNSLLLKELPFTDVTEGDWFNDEVSFTYWKKLMTGKSANIFAPSETLARAQFAVILWRMEGEPDIAYTQEFPDVPDGQFYTKAVLWAAKNGIITGYTNNKHFGPADNINREQMAVMMYRYANYKKYDTTLSQELTSFPDAGKVSGFATDAMKWCTAMKIITGDKGNLNPQGNTLRAECAAIISRFVKAYN